MSDARAFFGVFRDAGRSFSADGASFLAQALAFNTLFAAIPLSLVIVAMFGFVYGSAVGTHLALSAITTLVPELSDLVSSNVDGIVRYRGISGAIGLIGLIWSGKNVFGALSYALDRSLGVPSRHFVWEIVVATLLVPIVGIILLVATALPVVISLVVRVTGIDSLRVGPQIASYSASLAFVFVLVAAIYAYLPNRRSRWQFGVPGAVVAACCYSLAQAAFAIYTAHTNFLQLYGTLAAIFAFMLWIYVLAAIVLYGAHFSAQWERRFVPGLATRRTIETPPDTTTTLAS